jgi:RimJ/RimL family protein N-acetyltransferase
LKRARYDVVFMDMRMPGMDGPAAARAIRAAGDTTPILALTANAFAEDGDVARLAVTRRADGALLGELFLRLASKAALQAEIGYIFNPAFAGQGYAAEAVRALVGVCFSSLGLHRLYARLDTDNQGSIGLVERLRFRREAHLIQNDRFNGVWGDEFIYAVLAAEWAANAEPRRN